MNNMFYPKLAASNIKKNRKFYVPYILTCIGTVFMFYIMCFILFNPGIKKMPGGATLFTILSLGLAVIGIFSIIFLFYTNSFLIKRRKKELGLFNILGMEKRHIGKMLCFETLYIGCIGLIGGLISGIICSKLVMLLLLRVLNFSTSIDFYVSKQGILITLVVFSVIFVLILLSNLTRIHLTNPIELLKGGNTGEKEPKTKWILAVIGCLALGAGYFIAITTKSPIDALTLFFVAVLLVIVGTYCLFTAGSIVLLKALRNNKTYYYKTNHFTSVSGMIYRMKQNAAGLSNICILSTMVLVMISTTICLYIGVEDELKYRYSSDISIEKSYEFGETKEIDSIENTAVARMKKEKMEVVSKDKLKYLEILTEKKGDAFIFDKNPNKMVSSNKNMFVLMSAEDYNEWTGKEETLRKQEVLIFSDPEKLGDSFELFGTKYSVKRELSELPIESDYQLFLIKMHFVVVSDDEVIGEIYQKQKEFYGKDALSMKYRLNINLKGTDKEKISCYKQLKDLGDYVACRQAVSKEFYSVCGGFLFLGIFLGTLFLMATVLIIYYKQISEGYEDKERFEIMQKVGMSKEEVKHSIRSQVLTVFFLPLVAAGIHVCAAFPMITRLLILFNLTNTKLFVVCTIGTVLVFAIIYSMVYFITAKVYYKIVN